MELFDSHFHWGGEGGSPQEYCRRIERPERVWLMSVGGSLEESRLAARFAREIPYAWFAAGVHPQNAAPYQAARPDFGEFRAEAKLKAFGELGLDYFYEASDRQSQRRTLEELLALARAWEVPK